MSTPVEFGKYAKECVELATKATNQHYRIVLLSLAARWRQLSEMARREAEMRADDRDVRLG